MGMAIAVVQTRVGRFKTLFPWLHPDCYIALGHAQTVDGGHGLRMAQEGTKAKPLTGLKEFKGGKVPSMTGCFSRVAMAGATRSPLGR